MINLNVGQQIAFRKDYKVEFDGSTSYSYKNSFPTNTSTFSLYLIATPTVDTSRHVLFSVGTNGSTVLFEIGISTSDKLFVYNGISEIEVGEALVSNTLYNIGVIYSNSLIILYVNNNLYSSSLDVGTDGIDIRIGESILGGDFYEGLLNNVVLFTETHSRGVFSMIIGYPSFIFTPNDLIPSWFEDADARTSATQPTIVDADMEAIGTASYIPTSANLAKVGNAYEGSQCLELEYLSASTAFTHTPFISIAGNRYRHTFAVKSDGVATPSVYYGYPSTLWNGTNDTNWTLVSNESTASGVDRPKYQFYTSPLNGKVYFDEISYENLSITATAPTSASTLTGSFSNVTATQQPWVDSNGWINFDGTADMLIYDGSINAFDFLHDGSEWTISIPVNITSLAAVGCIIGNANSSTQYGILLLANTDGSLKLYIGAGGAWAVNASSAAGVIAANVPFILTMVCTGVAGTVKIYVDGVEVVSASASAMVAGTPAKKLHIANNGYSYYLPAKMTRPFIVNRALNATEQSSLESWYSTEYSIPI